MNKFDGWDMIKVDLVLLPMLFFIFLTSLTFWVLADINENNNEDEINRLLNYTNISDGIIPGITHNYENTNMIDVIKNTTPKLADVGLYFFIEISRRLALSLNFFGFLNYILYGLLIFYMFSCILNFLPIYYLFKNLSSLFGFKITKKRKEKDKCQKNQ